MHHRAVRLSRTDYECGTCGAATRVPVERIALGAVAGMLIKPCGQCGSATGIGQGTLEHDILGHFSETIRTFAETSKGRNLKIKMELKCSDIEAKP